MSNGFDLGSAAIGSVGGILGSLIGGAMQSHAMGKQFKYNAWLQKQSAQLNYANSKNLAKFNAAQIPTYTRKGLQDAGFNPMLAVQNGTTGSNVGSVGSAGGSSVGLPDYAGALSSGFSNALNYVHTLNETKQAEAIADNQYALADKTKVEKQTLLNKLPFVSDKEKAELGNIEKDTLKKEAEIHNIDETTRFIEKDFELRRRLGEMGIDVQRQGNLLKYNSSIYNSNTLAETMRGTRTDRLPFGFGSTYYDKRYKEFNNYGFNDQKYWHTNGY